MAAKKEIRVGDVGTEFVVTVMEDDQIVPIDSAMTMEIDFEKPDGSTVTKTAVHDTDGSDGAMKYVTTAGDLDQHGPWKIQGFVALPGGSWSSDIGKFKVHENIKRT